MRKRFFSRPLLLALIILPIFALPAGAGGFFGKASWLLDGTVLFFPENNGMNSDPMPVLPSLGAGVLWPIIDASKMGLSLELTLDFYMTNYGYDYDLDRAVPYAVENRSARVMGSLFATQAAGSYKFNSLVTGRFYAGPAVDLRIITIAANLRSDDKAEASKQTDSIRNYFWSKGRWLMPVFGIGTDFTLNDRFKLGADVRMWMPMYRLWSGENLPAIEGWRFGAGFRLTIR